MKKYTSKELFAMDAVEVYKLVLQGRISRFPAGFWVQPEAKQNAVKCVKFLIEDILNLSDEELKKQLSAKLFQKYKLTGMLSKCFKDVLFDAVDNAYPNKFNPWEFKNVSMGYWKDVDNGIKATKWLIEEKLKLSNEELKEQLSYKLFEDNYLTGMIGTCFNGSPYKAINSVYPNKFKPWEFKYISNGYWKDVDNGIKATKWLIEEKLKLSNEELKEQLSVRLFCDNGLGNMLKTCFKNSPFEAINTIYPNKFKPWEFKNVSNSYWNDINNSILAIKWLIEEKLNLSDEELKEQLSVKFFSENGLGGMLLTCFNDSPFKAIDTVYPNRFKVWEFKNVSNSYWNDVNNAIKATKWMVEEKLRLTDEELKEQLSAKVFMEYGLSGMLNICFKGSPYEAINTAYPGKFKREDFKNYR